MRALLIAPITLGALVAGYLWGYGVGEREGHDSDPDENPPATEHITSTPLPTSTWGTNGA